LKARVLVRPKEGIRDPQGLAVQDGLKALGFEGVKNVHVGRLVELEVDSVDQLSQMCEGLIANTLIEEFEIQTIEGEGS